MYSQKGVLTIWVPTIRTINANVDCVIGRKISDLRKFRKVLI